jgi:hypothetical protein
VLTHDRSTGPCDHPVVRPTLFTTVPLPKFVVLLSWLVTEKLPLVLIVRLPLFAPVVLAIVPGDQSVLLM